MAETSETRYLTYNFNNVLSNFRLTHACSSNRDVRANTAREGVQKSEIGNGYPLGTFLSPNLTPGDTAPVTSTKK